MKEGIVEFVQRCLICQQVKAKHKKPPELLALLPIPEWKWIHIIMYFVVGFPRTSQGLDAIWVVVDRLTKSVNFLVIRINYSMDKLAQVCILEKLWLY